MISLPTNVTGFQTYGVYLNSVTDGWFGPLTLLLFFVCSVLMLRDKSAEQNLMVSSLVALFVGGLFAAMEWVPMVWLIGYFGLAAGCFFVVRNKGEV